ANWPSSPTSAGWSTGRCSRPRSCSAATSCRPSGEDGPVSVFVPPVAPGRPPGRSVVVVIVAPVVWRAEIVFLGQRAPGGWLGVRPSRAAQTGQVNASGLMKDDPTASAAIVTAKEARAANAPRALSLAATSL